MIVVRFKVKCQSGKTDQALEAFKQVIIPSRSVKGVVNFDIGHDLADPDSIIATEVFEDRAALERQESLPEVGAVMAIFPEILAGEPEATIFHVSSSEPYSD